MEGKGTALDRSHPPAPGPAPILRLPSYQRVRLENGLTLLVVPHDDMPEVSARLVLASGAADDPRGLSGIALLVARALTEGTTTRSAREVAEALDYLGATFSVDVTNDASVLSLRFLSRVFDSALDLFAEIVAQAAFDEAEVGRLRDERLDEIASELDEPRIVAHLRLGEAIFGDHPYAFGEGGVAETVRDISAPAVRSMHARVYRPSGATLILVGDVPEIEQLQDRLAAAFSGWTGTPVDGQDVPDPGAADGRRVWAIQWPGPQSEIRIGGVGVTRLDAEYPAVVVMNAILGGLFSSRINMNLREDKGWTYGATSRFDARKKRGPYYIATAVDARATGAAVREIVKEMEGMKSAPPSAEELELAKNSLTFSLPRLFETVGQVSGRISHQVIYGLPDDYWTTHIELVKAVTPADVQEAAQRHLDVDRISVVVVGPVREVQAELASLGPVEIRDVRGRPAEL